MTCCINWNRSSKERGCAALFFCLEFTEMFNNPFFSAYAMSGEKRQGKEEIKENLKMRLRKFWGKERTGIWKGLKKHICNLQDTVILQWNPHIIVYKWPNQKRRASNGRFHLSIQPQEAPAMLAFHPHESTREHTGGNKLSILLYFFNFHFNCTLTPVSS